MTDKIRMSDITKWEISIDRGKMEETLKTSPGVVISRKAHPKDFFNFIVNQVSNEIPNRIHALVEGSFVGANDGEIELDCARNPLEGGIVRTMPFHYGENHRVLDSNHPLRKCFGCQTKIGFGDFRRRNCHTIRQKDLEKIWDSPYIQLYCCTCFKKKEKDKVSFDKFIKKRERLLNKAYRINEKFGFLID